jgi:putative aldouronate transport system substrate-binding protein
MKKKLFCKGSKFGLITMLLVFIVSATVFAAGGSQSPSGAGGLTEITHLVWDVGTMPKDQGTLTDSWWTRYVNAKVAPLGAKVKFIVMPRPQEGQILSTMLAANNAPDISKTYEMTLLKTYISGGGVADLTQYVDRFGSNIKSLYGPEILADVEYDGKIYYLPHYNNGITNSTTWIRKDWLDAIGMDVPSTTEEFYQVLKAIKEKDPGKRGASLIPLALSGGAFVNSMNIGFWEYERVALPGFMKESFTPEKLLTPYPMWPDVKEGWRYLSKLYHEGLFPDIFLTDKDESLFRQNIARGNVFAFMGPGHYPYNASYGFLYDRLLEVDPNAYLENIDTFKASKNAPRVEYRETNPLYEYKWFVPASCKNVELTVKVLNFLCSDEGYLVGAMGVPDVDYKMVNGLPTPIDREKYNARVPWLEPNYGTMAKAFPHPEDFEKFLNIYITRFNPVFHDKIKKEARRLSDIKGYPPTLGAPTPVADKLNPTVRNYWNEAIVKVVFASQSDFDRLYDEAVKEFKSLGGDDITAEALRIYAQQKH